MEHPRVVNGEETIDILEYPPFSIDLVAPATFHDRRSRFFADLQTDKTPTTEPRPTERLAPIPGEDDWGWFSSGAEIAKVVQRTW